MNTQLYSAPIHVAAEDVNIENIRLLLESPKNKADVNSNNKLGLTAIHILLGKLVEFAAWQNKAKNIRPNKMSDEEVDRNILDIFGSIILVCEQRELRSVFMYSLLWWCIPMFAGLILTTRPLCLCRLTGCPCRSRSWPR